MTHDELLTKINHRKITNQHLVKDLTIQQAKSLIAPLVALRAVVELHKPVEFIPEWKPRCNDCEIFYPCPTIQAIEKELG